MSQIMILHPCPTNVFVRVLFVLKALAHLMKPSYLTRFLCVCYLCITLLSTEIPPTFYSFEIILLNIGLRRNACYWSPPKRRSVSRGIAVEPSSLSSFEWHSASECFMAVTTGSLEEQEASIITAYHVGSNETVSLVSLPPFIFSLDLYMLPIAQSQRNPAYTRVYHDRHPVDRNGRPFFVRMTFGSRRSRYACVETLHAALGQGDTKSHRQPFIVVGGVACCPVDEHIDAWHGTVQLLAFCRISAESNHILHVRSSILVFCDLHFLYVAFCVRSLGLEGMSPL